jgi:hypothetical protein
MKIQYVRQSIRKISAKAVIETKVVREAEEKEAQKQYFDWSEPLS